MQPAGETGRVVTGQEAPVPAPPPPPPPRTSSRGPARPLPTWSRPAPLGRAVSAPGAAPLSSTLALSDESLGRDAASSNSSSSESVSSQRPTDAAALQRREAELRRKQAALQQQYARLQAMHGAAPRPGGEPQPAAAATDGTSEAAPRDQP